MDRNEFEVRRRGIFRVVIAELKKLFAGKVWMRLNPWIAIFDWRRNARLGPYT